MITKQGYVIIPHFPGQILLFGKRINQTDGNYENISSNGLALFELLDEARESAIEMKGKREGLEKIELGSLAIDLAETQEEAWIEFRKATDLVVVSMPGPRGEGYYFMGPASGKRDHPEAYPIPGAYLSQTNYKTFRRSNDNFETPFERARYLASEALRQGTCEGGGVTIARFKLRRLEEI